MKAGLQAAVIPLSVEGVARVASGALEASFKSLWLLYVMVAPRQWCD